MAGGRSFVDGILVMDKRKASKMVINGIIIGVLFGVVLLTSQSISANAGSWATWQDNLNLRQYENHEIGYDDYTARAREIDDIQIFMQFQDVIFVNVARAGVALGFLIIAIGFLGFATNDQIDERTRKVALILAGLLLLAIMLPFVGGIALYIT